ncbi:MAG: ketohydroxyglutarate aldolase [Actinomycetota bacterium]|nr:ketohydroxyglutarate aldolase [Actinomycetota bacterium]
MDEKITVTVGDDHVGDIAGVAEQLQAAGMNVDQVLDAVGIITGSVPSERRDALERLPGVAAVEGEHSFQIPPPDAEVQ